MAPMVLLSHKELRKPHEGAVKQAGRAIKDFLLRYKGPVAAVDLGPAFAAAMLVPSDDADWPQRLGIAVVTYVLAPIAVWIVISLVGGLFVMKRQRDTARMERDYWRLRAGDTVDYFDLASLLRWHIRWGRSLYWRTFWSGHMGAVRSDVNAWHSKLQIDLKPVKTWERDWGNPGDPDIGRSAVRSWLRERLERLKGLL